MVNSRQCVSNFIVALPSDLKNTHTQYTHTTHIQTHTNNYLFIYLVSFHFRENVYIKVGFEGVLFK